MASGHHRNISPQENCVGNLSWGWFYILQLLLFLWNALNVADGREKYTPYCVY